MQAKILLCKVLEDVEDPFASHCNTVSGQTYGAGSRVTKSRLRTERSKSPQLYHKNQKSDIRGPKVGLELSLGVRWEQNIVG